MNLRIYIFIIALLSSQLFAQKEYPRIVGDIGVGVGGQITTALGDFSDFAGVAAGISGTGEYAFSSYWVVNFTASGQRFSGTAPDTLLLPGEVFFKDDLSASNSVNSFFLGSRLFSHPKAKVQLFLGGNIGLERISIKLENTDAINDVTTVVSEEKKYRLGLSPEVGVRYNNSIDVAIIYSAFSDGSYTGIRAGFMLPLRKW